MKDICVWILNIILPHTCLVCRKVVADGPSLCVDCWKKIRFIGEPWCVKCGVPLDFESGMCGECLAKDQPFDRMISVFLYSSYSKQLLFKLKHGDASYIAPMLALWMYRSGKEIFDNYKVDFIIPVPLHWKRLLKRKSNQSALLANELSKLSKIPTAHDVLKRRKFIKSQDGLTIKQRKKNVSCAFCIVDKKKIAGKSVILVDDVCPTGATVKECARILKKKYVKNVYILTVARVIKTF